MPIKNTATAVRFNLSSCSDIGSFLSWLSDCSGNFIESLKTHKKVRSLLDDNVYRFKEPDFNSIAYQLDEMERDLKILYRRTQIIEKQLINRPSHMHIGDWNMHGIDLINTYDSFKIRWELIWSRLKNKLGIAINY